ncbi:SWI/SNF and RSC complex subunit Ssr3 [Gurleya vavrai]
MIQNYEYMREIEKKLDKIVLKKHLQIEEEHNARISCIKRLRIFLKIKITNNSLYLRIDGRVINDYQNMIEMQTSELIKSLFVISNEKNNKIYEKEDLIESVFEWHQSEDIFDSFEIKFNSIPKSLKIVFDFDNSRDLVRLSAPLQNLLNIHTTTKTNVFIEIWKYIRINKLIQKNDKIICNDEFKKIFNCDFFYMHEMTNLFNIHFLPLDFLSFEVPISDYERVFDVVLEKDDLSEMPVLYKDKNINVLEKRIQNVLESIENVNDKRNVLKKFLGCPEGFANENILLEKMDLDYLNGNLNEGFFNDPEIQEQIYTMCKNKE